MREEQLGHLSAWQTIGSPEWREDGEGILRSPIWNQCVAVAGNHDLLKREDFLYPSPHSHADTDVSFEFRTFTSSWSVANFGIVLRAQDSVRFYCIEVADFPAAEARYGIRLFVQDGTGFRRDIASAEAAHPRQPDGTPTVGRPETFERATPGWMRIRARARGPRIEVLVNDRRVLRARDATYAVGRAGIVARGPNQFRRLRLSGVRCEPAAAWSVVPGEHPPFIHIWPDPGKEFGDNQTRPGIGRMHDGGIMAWFGVHGDPHYPEDILLVTSRDEGRTWRDPVLVAKLADGGGPGFFFSHRDGRLSCLYSYDWRVRARAFSSDGGRTWSKPEPFLIGGRPVTGHEGAGGIGAYSPVVRLGDGTLLQTLFHLEGSGAEETQRHRTFVIRSDDDGLTWTGPHWIDPENFRSNDCMILERRDGSLICFARCLDERFMWRSVSRNGGRTWSRQVRSACPRVDHHFMIRHTCGVYLLASRGEGIFVHSSVDEGRTWSRGTRISLCSGNVVMTEVADGRVLVVFHEGYRRQSRVRAQYLRVRRDGVVEPG